MILALAATAAGLGACTSSTNRQSAISTAPASSTPAATSTPAGSGSTAPPQPEPTLTATDPDAGKTVTVRLGQHLEIELGSTYWQFQPLAPGSVLSTVGTPVVHPAPSCIPGGGCGTAVAVYVAVATGTARISAVRSSCGEAEGCTGSSGTFGLIVVVA